MNRPLSLLAVPLLILCASAQADFYSHRYAGVSLSDAELQGFCTDAQAFVQEINAGGQKAVNSCGSSGDSWKIYGGWRWSPMLAVELSYQQLPESELDFRISADSGEYLEFSDRIQTHLANAYFIGHWPLGGGFSLFGKAGGGLWASDLSERQSGELYFAYPLEDGTFEPRLTPVSGHVADSRNGFHWAYGAGISYRYHNRWTLRAEWESFNNVGSDEFFSAYDVETASLGWSMHF